jgi:hypothetical protein
MENVDSFEDFLKKKSAENEKSKINWDERKTNWLNSIDKLYENINNWLTPFKNKSLITIKDEKKIELTEEYIGSYVVKRLDIYIGNDIVSLTPKGSLIIGSYGRIDMRGPKGEIMIIEPKWNEWKFAKRTLKLETWDINEDSFKAILQNLV